MNALQRDRFFDLAATAVAAIFLAFAGSVVWHKAIVPLPIVHEVHVAWRCAPGNVDTCTVLGEVERCTTCHDEKSHTHRDELIDSHESAGCVSCHGGDGLATTKQIAHETLVKPGDFETRCSTCHDDPPAQFATSLAKGRDAFVALRCGGCHASQATSSAVTPLDVLGLRATPIEIANALTTHHAYANDGLDEAARGAVASYLASRASIDVEGAMAHRASVPGSSTEEGRTLFTKLACATCHADNLVSIATTRLPDWVAYFLLDPSHANAASKMPSLRLSAREASSLAQYLVPTRTPSEAIDVHAKERGEVLVAEKKCGACHANKLEPHAMSLTNYGDTHDRASIGSKLNHAGFAFDKTAERDLTTYVLSQRSARARSDLRVARDEGAALYASLQCAGCHSLDDMNKTAPGPSLFGEGRRVRPQWLFEYFRAPQSHPVRPPFHPEWAFRDLVPADHVAVRMPTYELTESQTTSLTRFFSTRDHAAFPFSEGARSGATLSGESLTSAIGDLTHKDRGACMACHTIAIPDIARAQQDLDKLAPPLALAHDRLRPAWIESCILQAPQQVAGMPAFPHPEQAARLRDLILLLRDRTILPPAGAETTTPALGLGDLP